MCHLAEVMTHAAVLLHLHRPSPRKCLRGGAPGAAWVADRKKLAPALGSPGSPGPDGGAQLAPAAVSPCAERAAGEPPGAARGGEPWRGSLLRVHPFPVSFLRVRRVPEGGVRCSASGCGNRRASIL